MAVTPIDTKTKPLSPIDPYTNRNSWGEIDRVNPFVNNEGLLTIFLLDESMPGSMIRNSAVKGAVSTILPKGKVAVISCFYNGAEVVVPPTNSVLTASRQLTKLNKSVLGHLGDGLNLAIDMIDNIFGDKTGDKTLDSLTSILLVVLADSKAHGLLQTNHDVGCDIDFEAMEKKVASYQQKCEESALEAAKEISEKALLYKKNNLNLKCILIDTDHVDASQEWSKEGSRFAAALANSEYFHRPDLTDEKLLNILSQINGSL